MEILYEINSLENKKLVIWLNVLSLPLFFLFAFLFSLLAKVIQTRSENSYSFSLLGFLLFFIIFIVGVMWGHELIHGLFFKVFKPERKVKIGIKWKYGMAYATSPGSLYKKWQMLIIGLAPFVIWTLIFTLLFSMSVLTLPVYIAVASLHAAGCIGDFYFACILLVKFTGKEILVEDTETGLRIYKKKVG